MAQNTKRRSGIMPSVRLIPRPGEVVVRMYRVGHGDCFLLAFGRPAGDPFYMLIDCGAAGPGSPAPLSAVADDIAVATNNHLDVLAISHEHDDHISGFHAGPDRRAREVFERMRIDRLWLAWTEEHEAGDIMRDERKKVRSLVKSALARTTDVRVKSRLKKALEKLGNDNDVTDQETAKANHEALRWLQDRCMGTTMYLRPHRVIEGVEGLERIARVHVLGPPEDVAEIFAPGSPTRRMEQAGESYPRALVAEPTVEASFAAALGFGVDGGGSRASTQRRSLRPFDTCHALNIAEAKHNAFFREHYFKKGPAESSRIDDEWLVPAATLALNVASRANNACLVLAIELVESGHVLLFPGDAEVVNWLSWFGRGTTSPSDVAEASWEVQQADGSRTVVTARDLLRRTVLYKVGHHGSYNGTLARDGLEIMGKDGGRERWFTALLPVDEFGASRNYELPNPSVVRRLLERTEGRLVRSDEGSPPVQSPGVPRRGARRLPKIKAHFTGRVSKVTTPQFFDITIRSPRASTPG